MIGAKRSRTMRRPAFTLVEIMIVMGLFLIVTTAVVEIFVQTTRYGRQVVARAKIQDRVRGSLESMARTIRVSNIDYDSYDGGTLPAQPMTSIRLRNPNESYRWDGYSRPDWVIRLESDPTKCADLGSSSPCMILSEGWWSGGDLAAFNPQGTVVEDLRFYVSPSKDPFALNRDTGTYASDDQPLVTVYLRVRGLALKPSDEWVMSLQTTVTPRLYLR